MEENDATLQLYWSGGPFRVALVHQRESFSSDAVTKAVAVLEEFRTECQKAYFAFNGVRERSARCVDQVSAANEKKGCHLLCRDGFPGRRATTGTVDHCGNDPRGTSRLVGPRAATSRIGRTRRSW